MDRVVTCLGRGGKSEEPHDGPKSRRHYTEKNEAKGGGRGEVDLGVSSRSGCVDLGVSIWVCGSGCVDLGV